MHVNVSESVRELFPLLKVSTIEIRGLENKMVDKNLEDEKRRLEEYIRKNYLYFQDFEVIKNYNRFFKKFGKTYPISFQIKSILEGKSFPSQYTVVDAMFMAELKNMFLTAGHDLDLIKGDLETYIAKGSEIYVNISGKEIKLKVNDIVTQDKDGIISSVLYGPDQRTMITEKTRNFLFFSYFPYGENNDRIRAHFGDIVEYIKIFDTSFKRSDIKIYDLID